MANANKDRDPCSFEKFVLLRRKIRDLIAGNDLSSLRHYAQTNYLVKGALAVLALGDIGTPEDIPMLQNIRQTHNNAQFKANAKEAIELIKKIQTKS